MNVFSFSLSPRRNSDLILSLSGMTSYPSLSETVFERLRLRLTESEAIRHVDELIKQSTSAIVPTFVEKIHRIAQALKA